MFDLNEMTICTEVAVNVTDVIIEDLRTGEKIARTFYRPGNVFPKEQIMKELAEYGYKINSIGETDTIKGQANWSRVFARLIQEESL